MNGKTLFIFIASAPFFTLAATYRFHDSAHSMGMIKKGGGMARHPALLDKDRDDYVLIATAGVAPPYKGNARVVLEGDPTLSATFHNSEVPIDLGVYRHPAFRDNIYYDLRPKDRIALWVKIKRNQLPLQAQVAVAAPQQQGRSSEPPCSQCEPDNRGAAGDDPGKGASTRPLDGLEGKPRDTLKGAGRNDVWKVRSQNPATGPGRGMRPGMAAGLMAAQGPAVAFYDVATNEPLLRIPIRFTGDKGGGGDDH